MVPLQKEDPVSNSARAARSHKALIEGDLVADIRDTETLLSKGQPQERLGQTCPSGRVSGKTAPKLDWWFGGSGAVSH